MLGIWIYSFTYLKIIIIALILWQVLSKVLKIQQQRKQSPFLQGACEEGGTDKKHVENKHVLC